jgi:hypothetical protein
MAETVARPSISAFMSMQGLITNVTADYNSGQYYNMGTDFASIWKIFFNGNLKNG